MLSLKNVNAIAHFTDWIAAHVHVGGLGWNGFLTFAMLYYLIPRLYRTELFSRKLANVTLSEAEADLAVGKEAYLQNCVTCHGADGQGGVGPNLTDQYWLHGGDVKAVFKTIEYSIPEKGMVSWQNNFTPKQMQQLTSFILSLEGTEPANTKEPQGDFFERVVETEQAEIASEESNKQASL